MSIDRSLQDGHAELEASPGAALADLRVLFVDDNTLCCRIGYRVLTQMGAEVECATSGPEALAIAESEHFDLIVLDCAMPGMSGFDVAERLRRPGSRAADTPIMALTASTAASVRQRALKAGISRVMAKPLSFEVMLDAIAQGA